MTGAVCPKCGIAVTPGYVRCPKCRAPLPRLPRAHRPSAGPSGTAVAEKPRRPLWPFALVLLVGGWLFITYVAIPAFEDYGRQLRRDAGVASGASPDQGAPPAPGPAPAPAPAPGPAPVAAAPVARGPTPQAIAAELARSLQRKRLWSTVEIVGDHADIRSGSCREAGMASEIDAVAAALKAAGTSRLRCLEQSGTVVFQRDL